ncbi:MAG: YihY/virulence factor BrkB family protein, partial [Acidimicrobiales bacterium]
SGDRASQLGAGLAYYTLFALVPILFLSVSLAGILFGKDVADTTVEDSIADLVGSDIAMFVSDGIDQLRNENSSSLLPLVSFLALLYTASLLFSAWKEIVDIIWDLPRETGFWASAERRLFGVSVVVGSGLLLALMIFAEAVVGTLDRILASTVLDALVKFAGSMIPMALGALFLLVLFRYTPDTTVSWKSVWLGAAVAMLMLAVLAWGYGIYLGTFGFKGASGVAGTLLLGLALIYYSAQIMLYGIEITKVVHDRSARYEP